MASLSLHLYDRSGLIQTLRSRSFATWIVIALPAAYERTAQVVNKRRQSAAIIPHVSMPLQEFCQWRNSAKRNTHTKPQAVEAARGCPLGLTKFAEQMPSPYAAAAAVCNSAVICQQQLASINMDRYCCSMLLCVTGT